MKMKVIRLSCIGLGLLAVPPLLAQQAPGSAEISVQLREAEDQRQELQDQLKAVEARIAELRVALAQQQARGELGEERGSETTPDETGGYRVVCQRDINLYRGTSTKGGQQGRVPAGTPFFLLTYEERHWFRAQAGEREGYVYLHVDEDCPQTSEATRSEIRSAVAAHAKRVHQEEEVRLAAERSKLIAELSKKYSPDVARNIADRKFWVGMTKEMAIDSLGEPDDINRTGRAGGVTEQWVYEGSLFLYFENGRLRSWQDF